MRARPQDRLTLQAFRNANRNYSKGCTLAEFVQTLTPEESAATIEAVKDRSIQAAAIARVLRRRGWSRTEQVINRHRRDGCRTCGVTPNVG